ncbi:MAG: hypothetical protein JNN15_12730, partial [Blastocatellia bacterium]|nr:hypothetical protein [Blastocatellia bacterium]
MSVNASAYLVDWQKLLGLWQEIESLDFWIEAIEQESEWVQLYAADDWQQSWKAASAASDTYEDIRDELEAKPLFDKFYKA